MNKGHNADPDARRAWRREYMLAHRAKGDGLDDDPTDFTPETPLQSRMWKQLLRSAAR